MQRLELKSLPSTDPCWSMPCEDVGCFDLLTFLSRLCQLRLLSISVLGSDCSRPALESLVRPLAAPVIGLLEPQRLYLCAELYTISGCARAGASSRRKHDLLAVCAVPVLVFVVGVLVQIDPANFCVGIRPRHPQARAPRRQKGVI